MSIQARKLYWLTAAAFLIVIFLSFHKSSFSSYSNNQHSLEQKGHSDTSTNHDEDIDYDSGSKDNIYGGGDGTGAGSGGVKAPPPPPPAPVPPPPSVEKPSTPDTVAPPNISGKYDTLIVIPSSWTQIENRQWVRQTVFGIKNNLEPCKRHDGRIIYKFYIHGRASWLKTRIHSAEFMQGQVRELYGEFMEYSDHVFTNITVTDRHALWGDALSWAVETFIPQEKITVDKILIFDSSTVVDLHRMEQSAKTSMGPNGFIHTWGDHVPFAGMASFDVAQQIVKNRITIKQNHQLDDLFTAAGLYLTGPASKLKIKKGRGQLWASDIDTLDATSEVVGQVYQLEDWTPIAEKLKIQPTPACATDIHRKKNIAVLTSSYIYADMCMAEASLPSAENKRNYASKHGYDFVARAAEFAQEEFRGRRLVWGKIGAIQKVLPHYEWLFWMDMDAVIADLNKDVRGIIREAEEKNPNKEQEISLIVVQPVRDKMLNAGVMLIKNTDWSRRFFSEVQTKADWYHKSSYEQAAIWEVMNLPEWKSGVYIFEKNDHVMNTFPKQYEEGDFIVHFAPDGCPSKPVLEALEKIKNDQSILGVGV
ncbi:galactosyl transferase GMA12/MNN10 family-domain-containing protein [Mortierella sp. GBAus27b]|nr:hypothetical protein BGX31_001628 [Mortierella sp. GBA43]KAI8357012.1 galactosyl transferase GMA12/MNN10 family-domain-containing protein [Mortierella sp. GBAus27b]